MSITVFTYINKGVLQKSKFLFKSPNAQLMENSGSKNEGTSTTNVDERNDT